MHPNPIFRPHDDEKALGLARARGFGTLIVADAGTVMAAHIPFVLHETRIEAHLVRSNPIARRLRSGEARGLLIVSGPDGYVSPDWYLQADQVPTWNYVAVHLRGRLCVLEHTALLGHLEELSETNERQLVPKKIWTHHKMSPGVMDQMMRQIVPVAMEIEEIDSTWKLNQNKTEDARLSAADAMERFGHGHEIGALAELMRGQKKSE